MLNSQCSIPIRTEGGRTSPTSTSAENCALGIEHWSDPGSDAEQWILPGYFCASPKSRPAHCQSAGSFLPRLRRQSEPVASQGGPAVSRQDPPPPGSRRAPMASHPRHAVHQRESSPHLFLPIECVFPPLSTLDTKEAQLSAVPDPDIDC